MPGWVKTVLWIAILLIGAQALHIDIPALINSASQVIGAVLKEIQQAFRG